VYDPGRLYNLDSKLLLFFGRQRGSCPISMEVLWSGRAVVVKVKYPNSHERLV
jgi:hypothetical protein